MKLTCVNHYLKEAINLSERITGRNLALPVLNSILLSAKNNKLKALATNLEIGIEITIPVKIEKEGIVAVPAKILNGLISGFSDENINLEVKNNNLIISTKNTSSIIKGYPVDDFPLLPLVKKEHSFSLPVRDLIFGLKSVWHAASLSDIKPEIASILISSPKSHPLTFAATDSFRLAEKIFSNNTSSFPLLLLPQRSAGEIIRIFEGKEGDVSFFIDKNQAAIICDNIRFISRLTEGRFPDYKQIIPKDFSTKIIIDKDIFHKALKTTSVFSGRLNELKFHIHIDDKLLEITASNPELGEHITHLPIEAEGQPLEIAFNHRYLLDGLQFINSSRLLLGFNGLDRPLVVRGTEDSSYFYLVMPMKNI